MCTLSFEGDLGEDLCFLLILVLVLESEKLGWDLLIL